MICKKERTTKCANCGEGHTANYRGCKAHQLAKSQKTATGSAHRLQAPIYPRLPVLSQNIRNLLNTPNMNARNRERFPQPTQPSQENTKPTINFGSIGQIINLVKPLFELFDFKRLFLNIKNILNSIKNKTDPTTKLINIVMAVCEYIK